ALTSEAPPSVLDALTPAERQVAVLVSRGLTSRQIAEELYVSPRTVDAHLTHIYRKLGISTRARLAALVAEA
ncbi:MAG: helix-turn-helix transcriptional regulator, partial [Nocardioides sp.]|nr:helix-turn-helix transcriptional regulator [Nocardioides sp.]